MHVVQALDCAAEKVPAAQLAHSASATAPLLPPALPAGQARQALEALAPRSALYVPTSHVMHVVMPLSAPNFPASHSEQDDDEEFEEYFPGLQLEHVVTPTLSEYPPSEQSEQTEAAAAAENFPRLQSRQLVSEVAPLSGPYLPAVHDGHAKFPSCKDPVW